MKEYIKNNLTPLLIGVLIGILYGNITTLIEGIILKIAMIYAK